MLQQKPYEISLLPGHDLVTNADLCLARSNTPTQWEFTKRNSSLHWCWKTLRSKRGILMKTNHYRHNHLWMPKKSKRLYIYRYTVSQKNCTKLFLSELCQISINFNNFWWVEEKMAKIIRFINIFHLTSLMSSHYLVKHKSTKLLHNE